MFIGAHIGISGGIDLAPHVAKEIGCECMQVFSKNQRQWSVPPLDPEVAKAFRRNLQAEGIRSVAAHAAYLINLGTGESTLKGRSRAGLVTELQRAGQLGIPFVILHPGAHMGQGIEKGLENISEGARLALEKTEGSGVRLLFENSAGAGTTVGSDLNELAKLAELVGMPDRTGFCIDTCHLFVSGFDFRTEKQYSDLVKILDHSVGCSNIHYFHLNDAKFPLGSHKDRHENIGNGEIGLAGFKNILNDKRFAKTCGVLETPIAPDKDNPYAAYVKDLKTLRGLLNVHA